MSLTVIAIFDIGKTNKKLFLFDEAYNIVFERSEQFPEIKDEDGDDCEDVEKLRAFVFDSLDEVINLKKVDLKAINFATYGASFVYVDEQGKVIAPLYNYLKPYPEVLKKKFYDTYGGEVNFSFVTASPVLGSLNSGMQVYRIKYEKPALFSKIKYALHLPQYMSFILTGKACTDITSIGSHTNLWDFTKNDYHSWVKNERVDEKLPPIVPSDKIIEATYQTFPYKAGVGLHDSSAALIPYLVNFNEPFVLISTGTWCISLNPFNHKPLTAEELNADCLCYLQYKGSPVKASRLFAGYIHDQQVDRIAKHFGVSTDHFKSIRFDLEISARIQRQTGASGTVVTSRNVKGSLFEKRKISDFVSMEEAYHQLIYDLVIQQYASTQLVLKGSTVKRIFVDGGFGKNPIYMNLLASFFPEVEVYAASVAQATALGAALAIHNSWNSKALPKDLIELKLYAVAREHQL
jgi:sugar (pentulose or hexulose) kinase